MTRRKLAYIVRHPIAARRFAKACKAPWKPWHIGATS